MLPIALFGAALGDVTFSPINYRAPDGQLRGILGRLPDVLIVADGWFRTRDAGWFDEAGFLYVDGRLDDVIVRGSENLSPSEIEEVLMSHAAVAEAAVFGVPDPEWGEAVAAVVVLHEGQQATEKELQDLVRGQLRSTKMPGVIKIWDELPYSPTGKLLRRVLREELASPSEG